MTRRATSSNTDSLIEEYVAGIVAEAPPLTEDQKHRIASLLSGGQR